MANEITVRAGLTVRKGNLDYQSRPAQIKADMDGTPSGPTPGSVLIATAGTNIDLSQLSNPGWCFMQNLDDTNYVEFGVWDTERSIFYMLGELLPGECAVFRLTRNFGEEFAGPGTGTTAATNLLRLMANTAACYVNVEVFER